MLMMLAGVLIACLAALQLMLMMLAGVGLSGCMPSDIAAASDNARWPVHVQPRVLQLMLMMLAGVGLSGCMPSGVAAAAYDAGPVHVQHGVLQLMLMMLADLGVSNIESGSSCSQVSSGSGCLQDCKKWMAVYFNRKTSIRRFLIGIPNWSP